VPNPPNAVAMAGKVNTIIIAIIMPKLFFMIASFQIGLDLLSGKYTQPFSLQTIRRYLLCCMPLTKASVRSLMNKT
jgi:hypothetical protein